ncbi:alpha/beta fold hydrolase [Enterobacter hormaechei]|uniref:alpha/beta fold hydrolase n=1 Tax=Enterobacter hormaechei TaxID=158836 RepID=UPI0028896D9E|nr:alpha/beta hydrolase [Enterobacter hormaechei]WNJ33858.1 alpha/beta hydrolase [Enterobacter hormaechei subsp. hormaechei]
MEYPLLDNTDLPLVLLGGTLCDARLWQPVIERLNVSAVLCITLTGAESAPQASQRLLSMLPPHFLLAGFSLGAIVALQIAADAPERVNGLTLISVNPLPVAPDTLASRREAVRTAQARGLANWLVSSLWQSYVAPSRLSDRFLQEIICRMAQACGIETFADQTEMAIHRQDNRAAFNALACPTLLLNGAQDVICTPQHHHVLAAGNANVTWHTVATGGHFIPLETPDEVAPLLRQWITECIQCATTH